MKILIKTFASVSEICKFREKEITVPEKSTVASAIELIAAEHKSLLKLSGLLSAVNGEYCDKSRILKDSDVLAIFPPVGGG